MSDSQLPKLDYDKPMIIYDYWSDAEKQPAYISFNGFNPTNEYFFEMKNIKEAEKLLNFLTKRTPISIYRPIVGRIPMNE